MKLITLTMLLLLITGCSTTDQVKVGVMGPMSGPSAFFGTFMNNGMSLALEEINSDIAFIVEDSQCAGQEAVNAAKKLLEIDRVDYIIGPLCNEAVLATKPYFEKTDVISIYVGVPSEEIASLGKNYYSFLPEIPYLMKAISDEMNKNNIQKVGILSLRSPFTDENRKHFIKNFNGEIVSDEEALFGDRDFRTQLLKIKESKPEAVFLISLQQELNNMLRQMEELGIDVPVYSIHTTETPQILEVSELAEGIIYPYPSDERPSSAAGDYKKKYFERFNFGADPYSANVYDGIMILDKFLIECNNDKACVQEKLDNLKDYEGANGFLTLDERGSGTYKAIMLKTLLNGEFVKLN